MTNRTVLITGASGNLGRGLIQKFLENDFRVAALDSARSASKPEVTEMVGSYEVDLMDEAAVEDVVTAVYSDFENVELAVFTVGGFAMGNLAETRMSDFDKMYRLNFQTAYTIARQVYLRMVQDGGGGQMVFIGSRPALHPDQAKDLIGYSLTKSLVFRLAEVINEEGKGKGVSASVVIPSVIDTPLNRVATPNEDFDKWVSPEEIAETIFQLTTPAGKKG